MTLRNKIEEAAVNQMKQVVKDVAVKQIKKVVKDAVIQKGVEGLKSNEKINELKDSGLNLIKNLKERGMSMLEKNKVKVEEKKEITLSDMSFGEFITYVVTTPEYKDKYGDCSIVSFLAVKCAETDIVKGRGKDWDTVIKNARLLESSGLDKKEGKRIVKALVDKLFGKEMGTEFGEHFGLVAIKSGVSKEVKDVKVGRKKLV